MGTDFEMGNLYFSTDDGMAFQKLFEGANTTLFYDEMDAKCINEVFVPCLTDNCKFTASIEHMNRRMIRAMLVGWRAKGPYRRRTVAKARKQMLFYQLQKLKIGSSPCNKKKV